MLLRVYHSPKGGPLRVYHSPKGVPLRVCNTVYTSQGVYHGVYLSGCVSPTGVPQGVSLLLVYLRVVSSRFTVGPCSCAFCTGFNVGFEPFLFPGWYSRFTVWHHFLLPLQSGFHLLARNLPLHGPCVEGLDSNNHARTVRKVCTTVN